MLFNLLLVGTVFADMIDEIFTDEFAEFKPFILIRSVGTNAAGGPAQPGVFLPVPGTYEGYIMPLSSYETTANKRSVAYLTHRLYVHVGVELLYNDRIEYEGNLFRVQRSDSIDASGSDSHQEYPLEQLVN